MASLDDILTVQKNGVIAINNLYHETVNADGFLNALEITTKTLVQAGKGKVISVAVIVAGSSDGTIYDAASTAAAVAGRRLCLFDMAVGIYAIRMPVQQGIVIEPGTGMTVSVAYS